MVGLEALEQALARFDDLAPRARNAADGGDPSALARLADRAIAGERRLADEGALRELAAIAPGSVDRFASYLAFPFAREAKARAELATLELAVGKGRWKPAEAMARLRLGEAAEREAALAALAALSGPDESLAKLEEMAPSMSARKRRAAPVAEGAKSGGILLPTPELMAELGLVASPAPAARSEEGPDRSPELAELVLALAESAAGSRPIEYGELRVAAAGQAVADFRVRHPWVASRDSLPFEQPVVPLIRTTARVSGAGDALSGAGALLGAEPSAALAFAAMTLPFSSCFADGGSDRRRSARAFGAAVGLFALDCELVGRSSGFEDFADRERDRLGFSRPPLMARMLWVGARFEGAPGEESTRYAGGARLEVLLGRGAALAFDLRERFDEDWFRNPRVTREVVEDGMRSTLGSVDQVIGWMKELQAL